MARFLRNSNDLVQVLFGALGPFAMFGPVFVPADPVIHAVLWPMTWIFICRNNYILHNHIHSPFFHKKWLNRWFEFWLALTTGMTAGNWRISHVHGHHIEHLTTLPRAQEYERQFHLEADHSFSVPGSLIYVFKTTPVQFLMPIKRMIQESISRKSYKRIYYRYYLFEQSALFIVVILALILNPFVSLTFVMLPYFFTYLVSRYVDYVSHVGLADDNALEIANVCTSPLYNKLYWNFGYHIVHHINPRAHWSMLEKEYHEMGFEELETNVAASVNFFGFFAPPKFYWHKAGRVVH